MIFLTVGTTKFPFNRLLKAVDCALLDLDKKEKLIAQIGESRYNFRYKNAEIFKEISFDKMIFYFEKGRVIIAHGGLGTISLALKFGKNKPLIVPRSKRFKEHVDDQQIFLAEFFKKKGLIETVLPEESLKEEVAHYIKSPDKPAKKARPSSLEKMIKQLIDYTEGI